jgi:hypothetical protein
MLLWRTDAQAVPPWIRSSNENIKRRTHSNVHHYFAEPKTRSDRTRWSKHKTCSGGVSTSSCTHGRPRTRWTDLIFWKQRAEKENKYTKEDTSLYGGEKLDRVLFCTTTLCSMIDGYQCFERTFHFHLHGRSEYFYRHQVTGWHYTVNYIFTPTLLTMIWT